MKSELSSAHADEKRATASVPGSRTCAPSALRRFRPAQQRGRVNGSAATRTLRQALQFARTAGFELVGGSLAAFRHPAPCACLHVVNQLVRYVT